MTRLIVYFNGQYINILADRLEEDERYLRGYRAGDLVAIFDIGGGVCVVVDENGKPLLLEES